MDTHTQPKHLTHKEIAIASGWELFRIYGDFTHYYGSGLSALPNQNHSMILQKTISIKTEA